MKLFVLRIAPRRKDRTTEALRDSDLIIGWSDAQGLLNERLTRSTFHRIIHDTYYAHERSRRASGQGTGSM